MTASDCGCRKGDLRFYNALIEEGNPDTAKCLMTGSDRTADIAGARPQPWQP